MRWQDVPFDPKVKSPMRFHQLPLLSNVMSPMRL